MRIGFTLAYLPDEILVYATHDHPEELDLKQYDYIELPDDIALKPNERLYYNTKTRVFRYEPVPEIPKPESVAEQIAKLEAIVAEQSAIIDDAIMRGVL